LVDQAPRGDDWIHEVKFDGYRLICHIKNNQVRMETRSQKDWTSSFTKIAAAVEKLQLKDAILDGEVVALDEKKHANFQSLQNALREESSQALTYYVFDIIYYQGHDLSAVPLIDRKGLLKKLLGTKSRSIIYSDHIVGNGDEVFKQACKLGLEGIVSKEANSPYVQKRGKYWLKVKCSQRQEFVVCGYTQPQGSRAHFGSLLLGYYNKKKELVYCGHVGTGFNGQSLKEIWQLLTQYKSDRMPFQKKPPGVSRTTWVDPKIAVEVEFLEWTTEGILRHPSFKGVRMDKPAKKIKKETVKKEKVIEKELKKGGGANKRSEAKLTHSDKILYPAEKISKQDVAQYYQLVQERILPHLINRPLTLLRCPQGISQACFYQRHLGQYDKEGEVLFTVEAKKKKGSEQYLYIKNIKGLLQLVQMGVLEIHPWGCTVDKVDKPDTIIFDLDPAPEVTWKKVVKAALRIKEELSQYDLPLFVKTTGGKGLHIVIPIQKRYTWEQVREFTQGFVDQMVEKYPKDYVGTMSKEKRKGKIFIDYLRNIQGATAIGPYSTRAREGATVAMPISWEELAELKNPKKFNVKSVLKEGLSKKDPWKEYGKSRGKLPKL
jgi:bifunctional non-homologous end joining protein LigD